MPTTKQKILQQAVRCFNAQGYQATTLVDIARSLAMSRGNLAYHFPDKEKLLGAIAREVEKKIAQAHSQSKEVASFANLQLSIQTYHQLQQQYPFIFGNATVLQHRSIQAVMKRWSERTIRGVLEAFAFAIEVGNMQPEPIPGIYRHLANNTWMVIYYWNAQKLVREDQGLENAEKHVWSTILPFFTEKGIQAFERHYGPSFIQELGPNFSQIQAPVQLF